MTCRFLVVVCLAAVGFASTPAQAQVPATDVFKIGDMAQAANDLRKAGEAFERFGASLEGIATTFAEALVMTSKHAAEMSGEFDPFGFKTAFRTIDRQSLAIERLQQAEIRRLRKQQKRLRKEVEDLRSRLP